MKKIPLFMQEGRKKEIKAIRGVVIREVNSRRNNGDLPILKSF
jgi:hypothetical protein